MKKMIVAALALAVLASCNQQASNTGADGYRFEAPTRDLRGLQVTVFAHDDRADMLKAADKAGAEVEQGRELQAWSTLTRNGCEIHVLNPAKEYEPEWIGHEMTHCIWGEWHQ